MSGHGGIEWRHEKGPSSAQYPSEQQKAMHHVVVKGRRLMGFTATAFSLATGAARDEGGDNDGVG